MKQTTKGAHGHAAASGATLDGESLAFGAKASEIEVARRRICSCFLCRCVLLVESADENFCFR
jgi:hypothetical protein